MTRTRDNNNKNAPEEAAGGNGPLAEEDAAKKAAETGAPDTSQQAGSGAESEAADGKQAEIEKRDREIAELKDLLKRRQADFENYKKRIVKSQDEYRKFAIRDFALDVININDDLLRAIEASATVKNGESIEQCHNSFVQGVLMISKLFEDVLKKYNIVSIDSINQAFDPSCNEAVEIELSDSVATDTITKVYQKGFKLDDLVIRSAKVKVARPSGQAAPQENGGASESEAKSVPN